MELGGVTLNALANLLQPEDGASDDEDQVSSSLFVCLFVHSFVYFFCIFFFKQNDFGVTLYILIIHYLLWSNLTYKNGGLRKQ